MDDSPLLPATQSAPLSSTVHRNYWVHRSFVDFPLQQRLVQEALDCHVRHSQNNGTTETATSNLLEMTHTLETSRTSISLALGMAGGGDVSHTLPLAVDVARRAYATAPPLDDAANPPTAPVTTHASHDTWPQMQAAHIGGGGPWSGVALLYGIHGHMVPHYDSPTRPESSSQEWLVCITLGNTIDFGCQDELLTLESGDVLVLDSRAVLHGVHRIHVDVTDTTNHAHLTVASRLQMPWPQARLGLLFWQGRDDDETNPVRETSDDMVDGMDRLFPDSDSCE